MSDNRDETRMPVPLPARVDDGPSGVVVAGSSLLAQLDAEIALTARAEANFEARIQAMENAAIVFEHRQKILERCYLSTIGRTRPEDWILMRDRAGIEVAMLGASGADLVAESYRIQVTGTRPVNEAGEFVPQRIPVPGREGVYTLRGWFDAVSYMTERYVTSVEVSKRSDEDFTGRSVTKDGSITMRGTDAVGALDSDLRASLQRLMFTKAVRILAGMTRVPRRELERAWEGTGKSTEQCRRGSGYGSGSERNAASLTPREVRAKAVELANEVTRRVGGDKAAARQLLMEITASADGAFAGFDTPDRITKDFIVQRGWERLRAHAVFGDDHTGTTGGEEP